MKLLFKRAISKIAELKLMKKDYIKRLIRTKMITKIIIVMVITKVLVLARVFATMFDHCLLSAHFVNIIII